MIVSAFSGQRNQSYNMNELAIYLRMMQFYSHICHNATSGTTFFEDHAFFGELYAAYETAYDDVVERCIGLGVSIDLFKLHQSAVNMLEAHKGIKADPKSMFKGVLEQENNMLKLIELAIPKATEGTKQFLGNLYDQSEMRKYKLGQRVK